MLGGGGRGSGRGGRLSAHVLILNRDLSVFLSVLYVFRIRFTLFPVRVFPLPFVSVCPFWLQCFLQLLSLPFLAVFSTFVFWSACCCRLPSCLRLELSALWISNGLRSVGVWRRSFRPHLPPPRLHAPPRPLQNQ